MRLADRTRIAARTLAMLAVLVFPVIALYEQRGHLDKEGELVTTGGSASAFSLPDRIVQMYDGANKVVFSVGRDGKVTLGPGFTTTDEASRVFLEGLSMRCCPCADGGTK